MSSVGFGIQPKVNYAASNAAKITINNGAALPAVVVSITITTTGKPVQIIATGDANPISNSWGVLKLYRDNTPIGQAIQFEGTANENNPYALSCIDLPDAGTYTYSVKLINSGGGNHQFGEVDGNRITCLELWGNP